MSETLVRKLGAEPIVPPLEEWQPAFFDTCGKLCPVMPSAAHAERYLDFLKHRIARQPTDLAAHVRRIMLARAYRQGTVVADALQELFRVLGNKGAGLRTHLLELCAPLLDAATLRWLHDSTDSSRSSATVLVSRSASLAPTITQSGQGDATELAEAIAYLDEGQVDEARELLETHLKASPGDAEATRLLLDIYLRARDTGALATLRAQLEPLPEPVRPLWEATAANLAKLA